MTDCVFCQRPIKKEMSLRFIFSFQPLNIPLACTNCLDKFQEIKQEMACPGCSRLQEDQTLCADCEKWQKYSPEVAPNHTALYTYNELARSYMNQFKFQGDVKLAGVFSEGLKQKLLPYTKTHLLTIIPSSDSSYKERGFNAVELLLDDANIAYEPLLKHVADTQKQSSKTRGERLRSVQPFALISPKELKGLERPVLVIDDVYTTGRTILHARERLEKFVPTASMTLFR